MPRLSQKHLPSSIISSNMLLTINCSHVLIQNLPALNLRFKLTTLNKLHGKLFKFKKASSTSQQPSITVTENIQCHTHVLHSVQKVKLGLTLCLQMPKPINSNNSSSKWYRTTSSVWASSSKACSGQKFMKPHQTCTIL